MVNPVSNLWQMFRGTVQGADSSRQLAAGVAIGMVVGLLPKESLLPYGILMVLLLSRANLLTAACSALLFGWASAGCDPISHWIGVRILTFEPLESVWAWLIQLPIVPWTRFDNTVVTGSLTLGIIAAIPVYWTSKRFFETYGAAVFDVVKESRSAQWLVGPANSNLSES